MTTGAQIAVSILTKLGITASLRRRTEGAYDSTTLTAAPTVSAPVPVRSSPPLGIEEGMRPDGQRYEGLSAILEASATPEPGDRLEIEDGFYNIVKVMGVYDKNGVACWMADLRGPLEPES